MLEKVSALKAFFNHSIKGILKGVVSLLVLFSDTLVAVQIDFRTPCEINLSNQVVNVKGNGLVQKKLENIKPRGSIAEPLIRQAANVEPKIRFSESDGSVSKSAVIQFYDNQGIEQLKNSASDNLYLDAFCFLNATQVFTFPVVKKHLSRQLQIFEVATNLHKKIMESPVQTVSAPTDSEQNISILIAAEAIDDVCSDKVGFNSNTIIIS